MKKPVVSRTLKKNLIGYSFILPNFIGFAVFVVLPVFFSILMSFFDFNGSKIQGFVGLGNYIEMFGNRIFKASIVHSLLYAVVTVPLTMAFSLMIAMFLNRKIKGLGLFRAIYFWPYVTAVVALAVVWNMLFNPDKGMINNLLHTAFGIPIDQLPRWAMSTNYSLLTIMLAQVWKSTGYFMIVYLAGLQSVPRELYEAAKIDGANGIKCFRFVTWPQLSSTTFFVIIMLTIGAFNAFELIYVMTEGGPGISSMVLVIHIYKMAFTKLRFGYASAVSVILLMIVGAVTALQFRLERKWVN